MNALRINLIAGAAALSMLGFGIAPAFASDNPDPYTYSYSPTSTQPVFAESCFVKQPVYDKAGKVVGHRTIDVCGR